MAVTIIFQVPGAGHEEYDAVMERLGPENPPGRIYHVCGPSEEGWMVVDVWESVEHFEKFLAEDLLPAARATGFFASLPQTFPVYNIIQGPQPG
jgi:hypothetical protein